MDLLLLIPQGPAEWLLAIGFFTAYGPPGKKLIAWMHTCELEDAIEDDDATSPGQPFLSEAQETNQEGSHVYAVSYRESRRAVSVRVSRG